MDVNELARGMVVEHIEACRQLSGDALTFIPRTKGFYTKRDEIAQLMERWLRELVPGSDFEVTNAGRDDYQVKRLA